MLPPWKLVDPERVLRLNDELRRELCVSHVLARSSFEAVAMSTMSDDVLFMTDSILGALACVHLTWSGKPDLHPSFPSTEFYNSWAEFSEREMIPMHEDIR